MLSSEDRSRATDGMCLEKECAIWNQDRPARMTAWSHGQNNQTLNSVPLKASLDSLGVSSISPHFHSLISDDAVLSFLSILGN